MTLCTHGYFHQHDNAAEAANCGLPAVVHFRDVRRPTGRDFRDRYQCPVICAVDVVTVGAAHRASTAMAAVTCPDCRDRLAGRI